jgi:hypothetical protein
MFIILLSGGLAGTGAFGQNRSGQAKPGGTERNAGGCSEDCPAWALREEVKALQEALAALRQDGKPPASRTGTPAKNPQPRRAPAQSGQSGKAQDSPAAPSAAPPARSRQNQPRPQANAKPKQSAAPPARSRQNPPGPQADTKPKQSAEPQTFAGGGYSSQSQRTAQSASGRQAGRAQNQPPSGNRGGSRQSGGPSVRQPSSQEISLGFVNALDGSALAAARIAIHGIGDFTTGQDGYIALPRNAPDGNYTLICSKPGFITAMIALSYSSGELSNRRFSLSPILEDGAYRIVLDWNNEPADLDLHLEKVKGYHISPRDSGAADDGTARLNRDEDHAYGPETITLQTVEAAETYNAYVLDFTSRNADESRSLANSGATVRLYKNDQLLNTFTVPPNREGNRWDVFRIVRGVIRPVNRIGNSK